VIRKIALAMATLLLILGVSRVAVPGQTPEVKEKPPMYSYVSNWSIPRPQWADMEKASGATQAILEKGLASGTLVAYGSDMTMVHEADGSTHDSWWSAMSMAGLLHVLAEIHKSGNATSSVLSSATKHWDSIYVSRYYNWHSGTWKDVYTHGSSYKLKADAPDSALDQLSKNMIVPLLEKELADGTIHEYEIDTQAIHTESPSMFYIFYIAANAEGVDKVSAAIRERLKANPLSGPAFSSMTDSTAHRDELALTSATYK
jgi:hypothetical protein